MWLIQLLYEAPDSLLPLPEYLLRGARAHLSLLGPLEYMVLFDEGPEYVESFVTACHGAKNLLVAMRRFCFTGSNSALSWQRQSITNFLQRFRPSAAAWAAS